MSRLWLAIALVIGLAVVVSVPAAADTITASANYAGAVPIVDSSSATRDLTLVGGGVVNDVEITIDFTKSGSGIDANGNPTGGGFTFNSEIVMRLTSADGTTVNLINSGTYSGESSSVRRTVTFDDDAATTVGGSSIVSGTFRPVGTLGSFDGEIAAGTWTLFFQDTVGADPLSVNAWSISVSTVPEPTSLALFGLGAVGLGFVRRRRRQSETA